METTWKQVVYDVADAIREKTNSSDKIPVGELSERIKRIGGVPEIKNSGVASYVSYNSDIEPGYFVDLVEKLSDDSEVKETVYDITPTRLFKEVEGQWYISSVRILDCVQYSENQFITAVAEYINPSYDNSSGVPTCYVHFELFTINNNNITKATSNYIETYSVGKGEFFKFNNKFYFECFASSRVRDKQEYNEYYRTHYMFNFHITISSNSISCNSYKYTAGASETSASVEMILDKKGYLHVTWNTGTAPASSPSSYPWRIMAYSITNTNTSIAISKNGTNMFEAPRVTTGLKNGYVGIKGVYGGSTVTEGTYTCSTSSYVLSKIEKAYESLKNLDNPCLVYNEWGGLNKKIYDVTNLTTFNDIEEHVIYNFDFSNDPYIIGKNVIINAIINDSFLIITSVFEGYQSYRKGYYKIENNNTATFLGVYDDDLSHIFTNFEGYYNAVENTLVLLEPQVTKVPCVKTSTSKISGITKTKCTPTTAGEVLVLEQ